MGAPSCGLGSHSSLVENCALGLGLAKSLEQDIRGFLQRCAEHGTATAVPTVCEICAQHTVGPQHSPPNTRVVCVSLVTQTRTPQRQPGPDWIAATPDLTPAQLALDKSCRTKRTQCATRLSGRNSKSAPKALESLERNTQQRQN